MYGKFGKDEVYVYRIGNPASTKALNGVLGTSYALLGAEQSSTDNSILDVNRKKYSLINYGNADKSKTIDALKTSTKEDSETILFYSDGKNSGIVLSNITIDFKEGKVKFNVALPEKQSTMPILTSKNIQISKFLDGNSYLLWNSDVKSGTAHVLVVRATERLKNLAEAGKSGITIENFKSEKADELPSFKHYDTVYSASVPLAEKFAILPKFEDEVLIFIAIESQSGSCAVRYVGCIENLSPSFGQFLYLKIDAIYYTYFAFGVILLTIVVTIVYYKKGYHKKGR